MPTFESDSKDKPKVKASSDIEQDFHPHRREGAEDGKGRAGSFTPSTIPPEVKDSISERINDMVRQSRGPDETLFALHETMAKVRSVVNAIKDWIWGLFHSDDSDGDRSDGSTKIPSYIRRSSNKGRNGKYNNRRSSNNSYRNKRRGNNNRRRYPPRNNKKGGNNNNRG